MPGYRLQLSSLPVHAAILLATLLPYCIHLGRSSVWDANEAFYAETPREMLVTGDYLAPKFNFQPRAQKPPLTYWAILVSYKFFGVNEFAVRFPGVLATVGVVLFSYASARLLFSPRAGIMAAIVAATTPRIFIMARRLPIDMLLLFFLTATLFFLVRAVQKSETRSWALAYVCASLGFLTKGPIAVMIPGGALLLWMLWIRRLSILEVRPWLGITIFACISLPWYALVYRAHGWTYIAPFFLRDNLGRFAAESMGPSRGPFYYFSVYAADFFPWSLLALGALYPLWTRRRVEPPLKSLSFGLPLIWCILAFFVFSASRNKQEYYIAPVYPAAALIIAGVLDKSLLKKNPRGLDQRDGSSELQASETASGVIQAHPLSWLAWLYGLLAFLLFSIALIMPYILGAFMPDTSPLLHYAPSLVLLGGSALLVWSIIRRRLGQCFPALAIPLWTIFMMGAIFYVPALESFRPVKGFCQLIEAQSGKEDEAGFFRTALPSMVYYLRRPIFQESSYDKMMQRFQSDRRVFCILTERDYASFADKIPGLRILDRHSRFSVRLRTLLNAGYFAGEELLLVSNQPHSEKGPIGTVQRHEK
jgi:4-amino-4-deoxy-L-arabinose transferase-like glycosyltransferase